MAVYQTIRYGRDEMSKHEDQIASASTTIEPGMLLERVAGSGGETRVQPHSGGTTGTTLFAVEARGRGMSATATGPDAYTVGGDEFVRYMACSGGGLHAKLAAGNSVSNGDPVVSNGDGTVIPFDSASHAGSDIVGEVEENLDISGEDASAFVEIEVTT